MARPRHAAIGALIAASAACGDVAPPPPSPFAQNAGCTPASCAALQQDGGAPTTCSAEACTSTATIQDVTLVVSYPDTTFTANAGVSVLLPPSYTSSPAARCSFFGDGIACDAKGVCSLCLQVPDAVSLGGSFVVNDSVPACLGRAASSSESLPVQVQLWPLTSIAPFAQATDTALPLLPTSGQMLVDPGFPIGGPSGAPPTTWTATLGPGLYEEDLLPLDTAYPPQIVSLEVSSSTQPQNAALQADPGECDVTPPALPFTTFKVTRASGTLAGFSAYFRDASTLRRVSSIAPLPDAASATASILTIGEWSESPLAPLPGALDLVIAPPAGATLPTYIDPIQAQQITATTYPALPPPVTVSGEVDGPNGEPIEADLVIDTVPPTGSADGIAICNASGDCTPAGYGSLQRPLSYSTTAHATAGQYAVVLPPGSYDVFVVPAPGVPAGAQSAPLKLQAVPGITVADGKTLVAAAQATFAGKVQLPNGQPLYGATVEAHASASLAGTSLAPARWPRTASTLTDASGAFSLAVDPGTYDVVVEPVDGTAFPWTTVTAQTVSAGQTLTFAPLVVPAPVLIDMTLESDNSALGGAIVQAFTSPPGQAYAVQLGTWMTDASGHLSMYVTPPR